MSDTPTPETDAALYPMNQVDIVWPEFARKLERERDEVRKELEEYRSIAENIGADKAVSEKEKAIRERDEAMEALDKMSAYIQKITGSCPLACFDAEPHSHPCSEVCDNFTDKINECWKKHFLNQTFFKSRGNKQQTD